jgi:hypothetical protein
MTARRKAEKSRMSKATVAVGLITAIHTIDMMQNTAPGR